MIARLEGLLREKSPTRVVVDAGGVGYELLIPLSTFSELPDEGKVVALFVHTHMRDSSIQLFGFGTERERSAFEMLLRASRVGPKLAQTILSGISSGDLLAAIRSADVNALRSVPGVGAKTAERILVELRDRAADFDDAAGGELGVGASGERPRETREEQALSALINLGVARPKAELAVAQAAKELGPDAAIEALIRAALRGLAR